MLVPDGSVGVQPLSGLPASARPTEAALPGALPSPEAGSVRRQSSLSRPGRGSRTREEAVSPFHHLLVDQRLLTVDQMQREIRAPVMIVNGSSLSIPQNPVTQLTFLRVGNSSQV